MADKPKKVTSKATVKKAPKVTGKVTTQKPGPFGFTGDKVLTDTERKDLVDNLVMSSRLLGDVRRISMKRSRVEIPKMSLGSSMIPAGGTPTGPVKPEFSSVVLTSSTLIMPWTVTNEFLQDSPDVAATEARVMKLMAMQAAQDITDLLINGRESSADALLRANDGILELATENVSLESGYKKRDVSSMFSEVVRALPTKYRGSPKKLQFIVSPNTWMDYVEELSNTKDGKSNTFLKSLASNPTYCDITVRAEPFMPDDKIVLTDPENIIFGLEDNLKMRKTMDGATAIKNDETYFALYMRMDIAIQNTEALIVGTIEPLKITRRIRAYNTLVRRPLHYIAHKLLKV